MNNVIQFFVILQKNYSRGLKTFMYIFIFSTHNDNFQMRCFRHKLLKLYYITNSKISYITIKERY